jgi:hypothetical protein
MRSSDILQYRLHNQHLVRPALATPVDVVRWFGAVQAQEYFDAKWAIGQRLGRATLAGLENAFNAGEILRTHVMRPTWHFVAPEDIRWMLELTAPRINSAMTSYNRILELNDALFAKSNAIIAKALRDGNYLTRQEIKPILERQGITTNVQRLAHIVSRAEIDGLICSGPRKGAKFTYALMDERAPKAKRMSFEESLAELALRYFTSHGPAQLQDFVWWSGLKTSDARKGIAILDTQLVSETIDGKTYWLASNMKPSRTASPMVHLLPIYDEYMIAYKDRSMFAPVVSRQMDARNNLIFNHMIILEGVIIGAWRREIKKDQMNLALHMFTTIRGAHQDALDEAIEAYGTFLNMPVSIQKS